MKLYANCPDRIELWAFGEEEPIRFVCGCYQCPQPDLTPEEYRAKIDREIDKSLFDESLSA